MCKAPKPPAPKEPEKPEFLRNPYLDAAIGRSSMVDQLRTGRSSLRTDIQTGLGIRRPGFTPARVPGIPAATAGTRPVPTDTLRSLTTGLSGIRLAVR